MLTIRASDYYSISYDAAAQNKIDQLGGTTYSRYKKSTQADIAITELKTANGNYSWSLGLPQIGTVINRANTSLTDNIVNSIPVSGTDDDGNNITYQLKTPASFYVVTGHCAATFTELDMADGITPQLQIQAQYRYRKTAGVATGTGFSVSSNSASLMNSQLATAAENYGLFNGSSEDSIVLSTCTKYDAIVNPQSGARKNVAWDEAERSYLYNASGGYNVDGTNIAKEHTENGVPSGTIFQDVWSSQNSPDFYYKVGLANYNEQSIEVLDRNTVHVEVTLPLAILADGSYRYTNLYKSVWYRTVLLGYLKELTLRLNYSVEAWQGTAFEVNTLNSKGTHPYKFNSERLANSGDNVAGTPWSSYYPNQIFDRYAKGKYYIQLRVRAKFMLLNDARIDTEVQIYDLRGRLISRNGTPCKFKIKRIIKTFDHGEFTYTINCLEE